MIVQQKHDERVSSKQDEAVRQLCVGTWITSRHRRTQRPSSGGAWKETRRTTHPDSRAAHADARGVRLITKGVRRVGANSSRFERHALAVDQRDGLWVFAEPWRD